MKKILTILAVVLLTSCACDNGKKCETTETGHIDSTEVSVDSTVVTTVTAGTTITE